MTKAIYFSFFVVLAGLIVRQPAAAAGALICGWALDQWATSQDAFFYANHGLTNWLTSLSLLAALAIRTLKGRSLFKPFTREYALVIAIYGWVLLSLIWTTQPKESLEQLGNNYRVIILFGFLLPLLVSDLKDLKAMCYTILTIGFVVAVLALTTGQWQGRTLKYETGGLITGEDMDTGNPLAIASAAAYVAIMAMLMNFRGAARFWQIFRYLVVATAFALSIRSGSRGQTVSILFVILCFLPYSRRFKDLRSFGAVAISLALFGAVTLFLLSKLTDANEVGTGMADRWTWTSFTGEYEAGRVQTSMKLLGAWANAGPFYWVVGLGTSAAFSPLICGYYPHMVFAEVLGELGIIGWLILWCFPIVVALHLREVWAYVKDDAEERGLMATLGAIGLFEIMMSFKQGSLLGSGQAFAIFVILGRTTMTLRARAHELQQLETGMYPMAPGDWEEDDESYDTSAGGVALAHGA